MFKKPKRNFRGKKPTEGELIGGEISKENLSETEEEAEGLCPVIVKPSKAKKSPTAAGNKSSKKEPVFIRSFGDEEDEGEVFKIKKSSHSRKVAKQLKRERKKEQEGKTVHHKPVKQEAEKTNENPVSDGQNGGADMELDSDTEEITGEEQEKDKEESHAFRTFLERGEIPDAHMIHAARKKRQHAREVGDFIPLESTDSPSGGPTKYEKVAAKSRLIRDDDLDASGDEERMEFAVNMAAKERQQMRDNFLSAEHGSDVEGDEEKGQRLVGEASDRENENDWEEQQIRKAVGVSAHQLQSDLRLQQQQQQGMVPGSYGATPYQQYDGTATGTGSVWWGGATAGGGTGRRRAAPLPAQITAEQIKTRLSEKFESVRQVHRVHVQEKANIEQGLAAKLESISLLEDLSDSGRGAQLGRQFTFYQQMRGYTRDLLDCFNEKMQQVNTLEAAYMSLVRQRADKLVKRRQEDIKDEADSGVMKPLPVGNTPKEKQAEEEKRRRTAERDARRSRRKRARLDRGLRDHHEGLSSDDEENHSDLSKFYSERDRIRRETDTVFSDVNEEFCDLVCIGEKFTEWKTLYLDSYSSAYISLCLPKLFSPIVKAELIGWVPWMKQCPSIEHMSWFDAALFYASASTTSSSPSSGEQPNEGDNDSTDTDVKLLPGVLEKDLLFTCGILCLPLRLRAYQSSFGELCETILLSV